MAGKGCLDKGAVNPIACLSMDSAEFERVFDRLRGILNNHAEDADFLLVTADTPTRYCLEGRTGPATLKAWRGKVKRPTIPVAWVEVGKAYVSYHLMGIYGNSRASAGMSKGLQARMQGKTCFNFKVSDEKLFQELEQLTGRSCAAFKSAGFIE